MKKVYLDNAATTFVRPEVLEVMLPFFTENYGNPSSVYEIARTTRQAIENAREKVAKVLNASPSEIYFTAGGTEADNWAIIGTTRANKKKGKHVITSVIEHHAVLHTCKFLEEEGYEVTYLPVDSDGLISLSELENAIRPDTVLITIMYANNEIGTIQPIKEIGEIARRHKVLFHTDAVQAVGAVPIDVADQNIDMLSLSAHKLNGPKGTGALYIKKGVNVSALIHGGGQERKKRAGTENVAGIVGLGTAIELKTQEMPEESNRLKELSDKLIDGIIEKIPNVKLNGHRTKRLPGNINFSFEFIEGESLLLLLDMKGICASSGSACTSGQLDPSHVLLSIGLPHEKAHGSLRLTIGKQNTVSDIDLVLGELPPIVQKLRDMSPLYEDYIKNKK